jgi:hypothetical protein
VTVLVSIDRARIAVARVRGWSSRGEHDRAAKALDAALRAIDEARAGLHAVPHAAPMLAPIIADLDRLTGGA